MTQEENKEEEYVEVQVEEEQLKKEKEHNPFQPTPGMWPHLGI